MNYYDEIKEKLIQSQIYDKAKDYAKDTNKVKVYYEIGRLLSEAGREYGKNIIKQYADKLMIEVGRKYNERTLYAMRKFYEVFQLEKLNAVRSILSWTHYRELIVLKNVNEIKYYIDICKRQHLSHRQLIEKIKNREYERLSEDAKEKLKLEKDLSMGDLVPNPIIVKVDLIDNKLTEYSLKQAILNNLDDFLKQLGSGFCYIGCEYKIKLGDRYNYIDLLLFNIDYNCYTVIELKTTELKKEHIGQIQVYMNYIDMNIKRDYHNDTIGIIICKQDNKYVIKYCSDERILSRTYQFV